MDNIIHIYGTQGIGKTTFTKKLFRNIHTVYIEYDSENVAIIIAKIVEAILKDADIIIDCFTHDDYPDKYFLDTIIELSNEILEYDSHASKIILVGENPLKGGYENIIFSWELNRDTSIKLF